MKLVIKIIVLIILISLHRWDYPIDELTGYPLNIYKSILVTAIGLVLLNVVISIWVRFYRRRKNMLYTQQDNVTAGVGNLYSIIVVLSLILMILSFAGIPLKTLFTSLSIVAAAIAIIFRDYIVEVISGIIISFSNFISLDDKVQLLGHKGRIVELSITKIGLINQDDDVIYIPNNKVYTSEIINYTKRGIKRVSIDFEMDLRYVKSIEDLEAKLIFELKPYESSIVNDSYTLKIENIFKDYLNMKFQYTLIYMDSELEKEIRRKTSRRIINFIKNQSIDEVDAEIVNND